MRFKQLADILWLAGLAMVITGCGMGSGRVRSSDYPFDFRVNCLVDGGHVVLVLIDGCRADLFDEMVRAGDLPAIKKYFVDRGSSAACALSTVPSITTASVAAIICGAYPGHVDVIGNRWFDQAGLRRNEVFSVSDFYTPNEYMRRKTIFEILGDEMTVSVCNRSSRGSTYNISMYYNLVAMRNYLFGDWGKVDESFLEQFGDVVECANREGVFPRLTFIHLPGLDHVSHCHGSFSREARAHLKKIDKAIGELMEALDRNGILDSVCRIIVADHGHMLLKKENYLLLEEYFARELGLSALDHASRVDRSKSRAERERYYKQFSVIVANNGRNSSLYVRHNPEGRWIPPERMPSWEEKPTWEELRNYQTPSGAVDLVEKLRRAKGIRFVIGQPREGEVAIFSAAGASLIRTQGPGGGSLFAYGVVSGEDPLGYRSDPRAAKLMDGDYHPSRGWLNATCDLSQADVVAQLPSLFESPCAGDLFVVAADEWDFEEVNMSSHGGFLKGEMQVPLVIAGPRIRKGRIGTVRIVDIMPTILDYLGCGDRISGLNLDGVSFWKEIEEK
ncbi:MAG: alkaline phosphatase family protein [Candidatus Aureabacteria bacterium]|nr:alkaline phosphatase family protein [Candidatus Auribacterota bacterium]